MCLLVHITAHNCSTQTVVIAQMSCTGGKEKPKPTPSMPKSQEVVLQGC